MFSKLIALIRQVIHKLIPYKNIESVERVSTPLSTEMTNALDLWYSMYLDRAPWKKPDTVKTLNLPALVCSEIARQVTLEMKWNITGKPGKEGGDPVNNPRSEYLKAEFEKLVSILRTKLEQGCAAGGMAIKPYFRDGHIYFDWVMDWSLYPIAFGDDGELTDVIFPDVYVQGKTYYTRLERHQLKGEDVEITQRAFKSNQADIIGTEISLTEVEPWKSLEPTATAKGCGGPLFGWYKVAMANNVDVDSPMGASVFAKATEVIRDVDDQYSRLMWEFEGSELAVDVDPMALRPKKDGTGQEMPRLNERLFRGVDLGTDDSYNVFSPTIRDGSLINGLNQCLMKVEDLCGLARGTLSDANVDARTATELKIVKQRSFATVADNQAALEECLRSVIRVMDFYATLYKAAPAGEYDVSFEWDDSIITDTDQQLNERLVLVDKKIMGKVEFRMWYFGETKAQAEAALKAIADEEAQQLLELESLLPKVPPVPGGPAQ